MDEKQIDSEKAYVIKQFKNNFQHLMGRPIILYGLGQNTKAILESQHSHKIVGLMDSENEGTQMWGYKIFSPSEVGCLTKDIIIVARESVQKNIYNRISYLTKLGISIYNIQGKKFNYDHELNYKKNLYWDTNLDILLRKIEQADAISFDLYDTLIMRSLPYATNVFDLIERELEEKHAIKINFAYIRKSIARELQRESPNYTIDEVYEKIKKDYNLEDKIVSKIKNIEMTIELENVFPRKSMVYALNYAKSCGKEIYLTSDMYFSSNYIITILDKCHIQNVFKNIYVSCEYNKSKLSGDIFQVLKNEIGEKKCLHIGDNIISDYKMPMKYGIQSFKILSAYEMLINSNLSGIMCHANTLQDSIMIGNLILNKCNGPFDLNKTKGDIIIETSEEMVEFTIIPLLLKFCSWLVSFMKYKQKSIILFSARDGFLINIIFNIIKKWAKGKFTLPKNIYFLTSRRAATVANLFTEEDIFKIIKKEWESGKKLKLREFVFIKLGLSIEGENVERVCSELVNNSNDFYKYLITTYGEKILQNATYERECYDRYIDGFNLDKYDEVFLFDLVTSGTVFCAMKRLICKEIKLVCLGTSNLPNDQLALDDDIISLFGNQFTNYGPNNNFMKVFKLWEKILAPKQGSFKCFDNNGPKFEKYEFSQTTKDITKMHRCIIRKIKEYQKNDIRIFERDISLEAVDFFINLIQEQYMSKELREFCLHYDGYNLAEEYIFL